MLSNDPSQRLLYKSLPFQGNVVVITQVLQPALTLRRSAVAYCDDSHISLVRPANPGFFRAVRPKSSSRIAIIIFSGYDLFTARQYCFSADLPSKSENSSGQKKTPPKRGIESWRHVEKALYERPSSNLLPPKAPRSIG